MMGGHLSPYDKCSHVQTSATWHKGKKVFVKILGNAALTINMPPKVVCSEQQLLTGIIYAEIAINTTLEIVDRWKE